MVRSDPTAHDGIRMVGSNGMFGTRDGFVQGRLALPGKGLRDPRPFIPRVGKAPPAFRCADAPVIRSRYNRRIWAPAAFNIEAWRDVPLQSRARLTARAGDRQGREAKDQAIGGAREEARRVAGAVDFKSGGVKRSAPRIAGSSRHRMGSAGETLSACQPQNTQ
jgi:hypothetical protein